MSTPAPITFNVDGEHVQVVGHLATLVESKTTPGEWHAVGFEDDEDRWTCTCKGWMVRKTCRHVTAIVRLNAGEADIRAIFDEGGEE